jgi:uncharacterized protein YPO0396
MGGAHLMSTEGTMVETFKADNDVQLTALKITRHRKGTDWSEDVRDDVACEIEAAIMAERIDVGALRAQLAERDARIATLEKESHDISVMHRAALGMAEEQRARADAAEERCRVATGAIDAQIDWVTELRERGVLEYPEYSAVHDRLCAALDAVAGTAMAPAAEPGKGGP